MRSDYALYMVAIIFFIITGMSIALAENLWVVTTAILGFLFIGLGYTQKPKRQATAIEVRIPAPSTPLPVVKEREVIREVVMIPCKYCGALMAQTATVCPNCGAKRTA